LLDEEVAGVSTFWLVVLGAAILAALALALWLFSTLEAGKSTPADEATDE
jgi:hypothetical protein